MNTVTLQGGPRHGETRSFDGPQLLCMQRTGPLPYQFVVHVYDVRGVYVGIRP